MGSRAQGNRKGETRCNESQIIKGEGEREREGDYGTAVARTEWLSPDIENHNKKRED